MSTIGWRNIHTHTHTELISVIGWRGRAQVALALRSRREEKLKVQHVEEVRERRPGKVK